MDSGISAGEDKSGPLGLFQRVGWHPILLSLLARARLDFLLCVPTHESLSNFVPLSVTRDLRVQDPRFVILQAPAPPTEALENAIADRERTHLVFSAHMERIHAYVH